MIAVILYHSGLGIAPRGLLGVDLFFVISGYLITGILAADLAYGRFSFRQFYMRRARRILPALLIVAMASALPAIWLMLPDDLENFGQSLVATALFANNLLLFLTGGYFELEAQFKPLVHTWSLGVEEQYYLIVPVLMLAAWRIGRRRGLVIAAAAITLISAVLWVNFPVQRFYLLPTRAWELGAGALVVLAEPRVRTWVASRRGAGFLAPVGLALALAAMFAPWPGLGASAVVAGTCLILLFGTSGGPAGVLLAARPAVAIGLISYSAYLLHQPIFAFTRIAMLEPPPAWLMAPLTVAVFPLAWLLWRYVERPYRAPGVNRLVLFSATLGRSLLVVAIGLVLHLSSGFRDRWPQLRDAGGSTNIEYNLRAEQLRDAPLGDGSDGLERVLVLGASFARDFANMAQETLPQTPRISLASYLLCAPLPSDIFARARNADLVVLSGRFDPHTMGCVATDYWQIRKATGTRVVVLGTKSFGYNNNALMLLPDAVRRDWRVRPLPDAVATNERGKRLIPAEDYIDMLGMLGDAEGKVRAFTPDDKLISQDRIHLTRPGARYVGGIILRHPAFAPLFRVTECREGADSGCPAPPPAS